LDRSSWLILYAKSTVSLKERSNAGATERVQLIKYSARRMKPIRMDKVFSEEDEADTDGSQFDLLSAIRAAIKPSPIQWKFRHVKGHQDDIRDAILDRWALLNIAMDSLAKMHWLEKSGQRQPLNSTITGECILASFHQR
jgi:hypothetical protein